jgi:hypothetical protein
MHKLAMAFLLGLTSFLVRAQVVQVEKPVVCSNLKTIVETISGDFQEQPTWRGNDARSKYIMFANSKTGTWTLIQYSDNIACVIGSGENGRQIFLGKTV